MNSLIERNSNRWDVTKVKSLFNPIVAADDILKILHSPTPLLDKWLWTEERSEKFSVRSAYNRHICHEKITVGGDCSSTYSTPSF